MTCVGCDIGINIDTNRLADAAEEIHRAIEMVPPEITIKFSGEAVSLTSSTAPMSMTVGVVIIARTF
jgi:hypothetical protein